MKNYKPEKSQQIDTDLLFEYHGKFYAIDVDEFSNRITMKENDEKEIHLPKYELYKALIEVVISPLPEEDDSGDEVLKHLKKQNINAPFDFKLAINTLIKDGIIKNYE